MELTFQELICGLLRTGMNIIETGLLHRIRHLPGNYEVAQLFKTPHSLPN
jgi:hypothetical protein